MKRFILIIDAPSGELMRKRFVLVTTDNPELTLGEGRHRYYVTLGDAARALAHDDAPYATILAGSSLHARELTSRKRPRSRASLPTMVPRWLPSPMPLSTDTSASNRDVPTSPSAAAAASTMPEPTSARSAARNGANTGPGVGASYALGI